MKVQRYGNYSILRKTPPDLPSTHVPRTCPESSSPTGQEVEFTSTCEVVKILSAKYPTDSIITEVYIRIMNFEPAAGQSAVEYAQALWAKAVCCMQIYNKSLLKEPFFKEQTSRSDKAFEGTGLRTRQNRYKVSLSQTVTQHPVCVQANARIRTFNTRTDKRAQQNY